MVTAVYTDRKEEFYSYVTKYLKDHSNINERRKARFKKLAAIRYAEILTSQDVVERRKYVERLKFVEKQLEEKLKTVRQQIQYLSDATKRPFILSHCIEEYSEN